MSACQKDSKGGTLIRSRSESRKRSSASGDIFPLLGFTEKSLTE